MKSNYRRIGDCIKIVDEKNKELAVKKLLGVNRTKNFMPSVANSTDLDLSKYKIVRKDRFACNLMHVGRDEVFPVSLYTDDLPAIVSPAYITFEVSDPHSILPEYLMMLFQREEFDRFTWFVSDSSIRGGLEWERFCDVMIPLPSSLEDQRHSCDLYSSLLKNHQSYSKSVSDLQLICDSFMQDLTISNSPVLLGPLVEQSNETNYGLGLDKVRGVSISKTLIRPKANMTDVDLTDYKLLKKSEFVFNPNTARMGEKIPIALNTEEDFLVSKIYPVFRIRPEIELLPEFLLLWFKRPAFDRYARFHSWGSARETFNWEDMCNVKLPKPDLHVQKSIVAIHEVLESRKSVNIKIKNMIAPIAPVLIKGIIESLEIATK
jgi:type I restriction enzyme, S subunit